jgi:circadian clock protein KaiB
LLLRLFVAGDAPNSREAIANLKTILERSRSSNSIELEIIDVLEEPLRAMEEGVFVTPTLVGNNARPVSIVGTLRDHERVLQALGLPDREDHDG